MDIFGIALDVVLIIANTAVVVLLGISIARDIKKRK